MKRSSSRFVAIVLAASFALVSSIAIGAFVWEKTVSASDSTDRVVSRGGADASSTREPERSTEPTRETEPKRTEPNRTEPSRTDDGAEPSQESGSAESTPPKPSGDPKPLDEKPDVLEQFPDGKVRMIAKHPEGRTVVLPMVKSDYSVDIRGDLATVSIEQTFENPGEVPLNATYQLPMAEDAAVYEMIMRVGDRRIRGVVKKKEKARKEYEEAKDEGKAAALLEQQRANLFTQKLANVMPNRPVKVTIKYVENVEKVDGRYQLVVPLVVGPRYEPADMSDNQLVESDTSSDDSSVQLPPASELQAPETVDPDRVDIDVRLDGGVPVRNVESKTHAIATEKVDPRTRRIGLEKGRTIGNRHFVLGYGLEGRSTQAGVLTHWSDEQEEGYFSVLVEPPAQPDSEEIAPREMVFLLDTSGSMNGAPMETSKEYMRRTLRNLRPKDAFRIVEFDSDTGAMSTEPLKAAESNIERGLAYVESLQGGGGTELVPGLERALGPKGEEDRIRIATVLSDGYVGNEYEVVRTVRREIGDTRLAVLGIGSGTNRFALEEMAKLGRGFTRYLDPTERRERADAAAKVADEVAEKLRTPVLTDVSVDWGELTPGQVTPDPIPDLFAGQSVRIMGRYDEPGDYEITVRGRAGGDEVEMPVEVELPGEPTDGRAVELTWARSRVGDYMHQLMTPDELRSGSLDDEGLQNLVTQLGLTHDIATKWTSFVAVSEKVVNDNPKANADGSVPEPQVANVKSSGYDRPSKLSVGSEPTAVGALALSALLILGFVARAR